MLIQWQGCLLDYLRSRGRAVITIAAQLGFCRDICAAMEYLEEQKFVHRYIILHSQFRSLIHIYTFYMIANAASYGSLPSLIAI